MFPALSDHGQASCNPPSFCAAGASGERPMTVNRLRGPSLAALACVLAGALAMTAAPPTALNRIISFPRKL